MLGAAGWLLAAAATACSPARDAGPAPAATDDVARAAVAAAYDLTLGMSHTVEAASPGFTSKGTVDPEAERGVLSIQQVGSTGAAVTAEVRRIADDTWIRTDGLDGIDAEKWIHVASERTIDTVVGIDTDATSEELMRTLVAVRGTAPLFSGTIIFDMPSGALNARLGLAAPATTLAPFTATVDADGRLTSMTMEVDAGTGPIVVTTTFSGFEELVSVAAPPPADVVEGTDEMLAAFGIN
jgi:hypothetical protein